MFGTYTIKFFKKVLKKMGKYIFLYFIGIFAFLFNLVFRKKEKDQKDILFILFYQTGCYRLIDLIDKLEKKGVSVGCLYVEEEKYFLKLNFFPATNAFLSILKFLIWRYNPSIIIVQTDTLGPKIKEYLNKRNIKLINIAHGITFQSTLFNSINYNFYFIFGKKSYENLVKNKYLSQGECKLILSGSPFFQKEEFIQYSHRYFVTIAGTYFHEIYDKKDYEYFKKYYESLDRLISIHNDVIFLFKPHIRRCEDLEYKYIMKHKNVFLIDNSENIYKLLKFSKLLICDVSVSSLEAAAAGTPFIVYDWGYSKQGFYTATDLGDIIFFERSFDFLSLKKLFDERITEKYFYESQPKLLEYYKNNIEKEKSIDFISECLYKIYKNQDIEDFCINIRK